jgi:hypothetical protein
VWTRLQQRRAGDTILQYSVLPTCELMSGIICTIRTSMIRANVSPGTVIVTADETLKNIRLFHSGAFSSNSGSLGAV